MSLKIYLANGLFSEADRMYNEVIYDQLTKQGYEVYAPQKNMAINDKTKSADSIAIYEGDRNRLEWCDVLLVVLDGLVIGPGAAAEIGYMAAKNKKVLGLWTDTRESSKTVIPAKVDLLSVFAENQFAYINLFVVGAIKQNGYLVGSREEMMEKFLLLKEELKK